MHEHFHDILARGAMLLETVSMLREFVAFRSLLKNADVESRKTTWRNFVLHVISLLFFFFVLHAIYYPSSPSRLGIVSESSESLIFHFSMLMFTSSFSCRLRRLEVCTMCAKSVIRMFVVSTPDSDERQIMLRLFTCGIPALPSSLGASLWVDSGNCHRSCEEELESRVCRACSW
jgi:hypothetical protein